MKLSGKNTKSILLFSFVVLLFIVNVVDVKSQENHTLFIKNDTNYKKTIVYDNGAGEKNITVEGLSSISIPLNNENNLTIKVLNEKNKTIIPEREIDIEGSNTIITFNPDNVYIKAFTYVDWAGYGEGVAIALEEFEGDTFMTILIIVLAISGVILISYFQYKVYYD